MGFVQLKLVYRENSIFAPSVRFQQIANYKWLPRTEADNHGLFLYLENYEQR